MRAILLITGSELTRGETTDLNGPFLATELTCAGLQVEEVILAPDDPRLLAELVRRLMGEVAPGSRPGDETGVGGAR